VVLLPFVWQPFDEFRGAMLLIGWAVFLIPDKSFRGGFNKTKLLSLYYKKMGWPEDWGSKNNNPDEDMTKKKGEDKGFLIQKALPPR